jgi:uncharacterized protein YjbI with pentapeptide repeats
MLFPRVGKIVRKTSMWPYESVAGKAILRTAKVLGQLAIYGAVFSYIYGAPERARQRHYQALILLHAATSFPAEKRSLVARVLVHDREEIPGADLSGEDFTQMDFRGARMPGVRLTDAAIDGADFSCAAGFFVSDYWLRSSSRCTGRCTCLEGALIATKNIYRNKFDHANLQYATLGRMKTETSVEDSSFLGAQMQGIVIQYARLKNNMFSRADMEKSKWLGGAILAGVSFVGANLSGARFYGLDFQSGHGTDFTDADLSEIRVSDQLVPLQDDELKKNDIRLNNAILCRTKFSKGVSLRDCPK